MGELCNEHSVPPSRSGFCAGETLYSTAVNRLVVERCVSADGVSLPDAAVIADKARNSPSFKIQHKDDPRLHNGEVGRIGIIKRCRKEIVIAITIDIGPDPGHGSCLSEESFQLFTVPMDGLLERVQCRSQLCILF